MTGLLRYELGFDGVAVSDALDMKALAQGSAQVGATIAAVRAGIGLLLGTVGGYAPDHIEAGLREAVLRGEISAELVAAAATRLGALRDWLAGFTDPPLDVVGCAEHRALAAQLAARSITLVRDDAGLLPLRLPAGARLAVVMPQPADLTPADTSSTVAPGLAEAIGRHHPVAEAIVTSPSPSTAEIAAARERVAGADLLVLGTISASLDPAQAELARVLLAAGVPTITVALRTPWDLLLYPESRTHLCTYGILPPTTDALAAALFGEAPLGGRLPVELAGLYPRGHGLAR
jgi:beta-N-acetylhexosaminidase